MCYENLSNFDLSHEQMKRNKLNKNIDLVSIYYDVCRG